MADFVASVNGLSLQRRDDYEDLSDAEAKILLNSLTYWPEEEYSGDDVVGLASKHRRVECKEGSNMLGRKDSKDKRPLCRWSGKSGKGGKGNSEGDSKGSSKGERSVFEGDSKGSSDSKGSNGDGKIVLFVEEMLELM